MCTPFFQDAAVSARKAEVSRKRAEDIAAGTVQMNGRELFLHEPWVFDNSRYWGFLLSFHCFIIHKNSLWSCFEIFYFWIKIFSVTIYFRNMKFVPLAKERKQWKDCFWMSQGWICFMLRTLWIMSCWKITSCCPCNDEFILLRLSIFI